MNRTADFSDADIEQGIKNFEGVRNLCKIIRDGLQPNDRMRIHFTEVVKFCNQQIAASNKLLLGKRIEIVH